MLRYFAVSCFIILCLSGSFQRPSKATVGEPLSSNSLQFTNYSGKCVLPSQINTFISSANDAAALYGDDLANNLAYIRNTMNSK